MRKFKQNVWRISLSMMWMVIVFLISCKPSTDSKASETTPQEPKDTLKAQTDTVKADTIKKDTTAQVVVPKKKKKKIINKPVIEQPGPVCKYGVIRKVTPAGGDN
jgi:hypothetical protein